MIYTTLRDNKANDIDIELYCEETITAVGSLFSDDEKYLDNWRNTDYNKLHEDYSQRMNNNRGHE